MLSAALGAEEVDATGVINVLAKSSALRTVFVSLIHSKKLESSEFKGGNISA